METIDIEVTPASMASLQDPPAPVQFHEGWAGSSDGSRQSLSSLRVPLGMVKSWNMEEVLGLGVWCVLCVCVCVCVCVRVC